MKRSYLIEGLVIGLFSLLFLPYAFAAGIETNSLETVVFKDTFKVFNKAYWKTMDNVVYQPEYSWAELRGNGGNWNCQLWSDTVYDRKTYPIFKINFKFNKDIHSFHVGVDGKSLEGSPFGTGVYRRIAVVRDSDGSMFLQFYDEYGQNRRICNLPGTFQPDTWYTAEFEFSPVDAKAYCYPQGSARPGKPIAIMNTHDWNPNIHCWNYRGVGYIGGVVVTRAGADICNPPAITRLEIIPAIVAVTTNNSAEFKVQGYDASNNCVSYQTGIMSPIIWSIVSGSGTFSGVIGTNATFIAGKSPGNVTNKGNYWND
ncbi:MAG: hypothetical protein QME49_02200 [bacterium]|nr:hypothetical protein [bacterium]